MDLIERIDEMQVLVEEAKSVPLSSSAVINREEFLELLAQLKEEVPDEIRQARWLTRDRDELLARARTEAEKIIAEARGQRDRLLSRTEIVHAAKREAERLIEEANQRGARIQHEAEDYVDQKLAAFEILLNKTIATVTKGREQLRGTKQDGPEALSNGAPRGSVEAPFDAAAAELHSPAF